jgi:hypothetical protein
LWLTQFPAYAHRHLFFSLTVLGAFQGTTLGLEECNKESYDVELGTYWAIITTINDPSPRKNIHMATGMTL